MNNRSSVTKRIAIGMTAFISLISCSDTPIQSSEESSSTVEYASDENAAADKKTIALTYAVATKPTAEEQAVIERFNEADNGYEITVKDYSEYYDSPDAEWFQISDEQRESLNVTITQDIINGRIDIVRDQYLVPSGTMDILASKGGLADLYPFMEKDEDVNKTTLNSHVLELNETNGKLYFLPTFYYISTLVGQTRYVGEDEHWTIDDFIDRWDKMPEGSTISGYRQKDYVYMTMLQGALEQFIDTHTGEVSFDSPGFRKALQFCNTFDQPLTYYNEGDGQGASFVSKKMITGFTDLHFDIFSNEYSEPVTLIGYPTERGKGAFINAETNRFAICASISEERQQGAWEFLKMFAMEDYQIENAYSTATINVNGVKKTVLLSPKGIPINLNVYDKLAHDIIEGKADLGLSEDDPQITLTEDELNRLTAYINSIDKVTISMDSDLWTMIREEVLSYFNGERDIDETIEIIQNRAEIIISEKQ